MRPTFEQAAAVIAGLGCLLSLGWMATVESSIVDPFPVTAKFDPLQRLTAARPEIGPLEQYRVGGVNPFIPSKDRDVETATINRAQPTPNTTSRPPKTIAALPEIPKPEHQGPALPTLGGILRRGDQAIALITVPGSTTPGRLALGEAVDGWRLVELDGINGATVEKDGIRLDLSVQVQDKASAPVEGAPRPAAAVGNEILIAGLKVRPGSRPGTIVINGQEYAIAKVMAGQVPGVSIGHAGPGQLVVNGQPVPMEVLNALGAGLQPTPGPPEGMPPGGRPQKGPGMPPWMQQR